MTVTSSRTPEAVSIVRRDIRFEVDGHDVRTWHPDGLHVAHFFNALSLFFPEGERFFIESVRQFRDRVRSPQLRADVEAFIGQEATHGREHRRYNVALAESGLPAQELETGLRDELAKLRKLITPEDALAITIALEHFTAIMAHELLGDDRILAGTDPALAAIWRWHAIEETEHKAVAFDVYRETVGESGAAYRRRVRTMLATTLTFWMQVFRYHFHLVRADGAAMDLRGWWKLVRFLWINPGGMPRLIRAWLAYFRRDFHPWQRDDYGYVERWKATYAGAASARPA
ncbi:MAG: metal-dependent hydrolase [Deltaproteobacteria bacterium]|nr:MAG: metal-dependent hydrolase [Deltaproteobacteria bacterium]